MSWIIVNLGYETDLDWKRNGETKNPQSRMYQYVFRNCELSTITTNWVTPRTDYVLPPVSQTSCGAQFCRNLNAGKTPTSFNDFGRKYVEFGDGSDNIEAGHESETRAICNWSASFL